VENTHRSAFGLSSHFPTPDSFLRFNLQESFICEIFSGFKTSQQTKLCSKIGRFLCEVVLCSLTRYFVI